MDAEQYSKFIQFYQIIIPPLLKKYLQKEKWESYLDVGCGDGALLHTLYGHGFFSKKKVYAVDLSEKRIKIVKKICSDFSCFVNSACELKDISDSTIDLLTSTQVIEHVPSDEEMLCEIKRVLKKNGTVYITTVFKKWYGFGFHRCNGKWTLDNTHVREYTEEKRLTELIEKHGFKILENQKRVFSISFMEFLFQRFFSGKTKVERNVFENGFLKFLRRLRIPILGYYVWELVLKKQ